MSQAVSPDCVEFKVLTRDKLQECFQLASNNMIEGDPLSICGELTSEDFYLFLSVHAELLFSENVKDMNTFAVDSNTGKIIGVFLFVDLYEDEQVPEEMWAKLDNFQKIESAFVDIYDQYYNYREKMNETELQEGQIVKILVRTVDPQYRNMGLASKALKIAMELAKQRNYSYFISETSSLYSRKSFLRIGGESRGSINYSTWKDKDGNVFFEKAPQPHDSLHLMEIKL